MPLNNYALELRNQMDNQFNTSFVVRSLWSALALSEMLLLSSRGFPALRGRGQF